MTGTPRSSRLGRRHDTAALRTQGIAILPQACRGDRRCRRRTVAPDGGCRRVPGASSLQARPSESVWSCRGRATFRRFGGDRRVRRIDASKVDQVRARQTAVALPTGRAREQRGPPRLRSLGSQGRRRAAHGLRGLGHRLPRLGRSFAGPAWRRQARRIGWVARWTVQERRPPLHLRSPRRRTRRALARCSLSNRPTQG